MVTPADEALYNSITMHSVNLMRVEESLVRDMRRLLKSLEKDIIKALRDIDPTGPLQETYRTQRLMKLLQQTREMVASSYKKGATKLTGELIDLAQVEGSFLQGAINSSVHAELATAGITRTLASEIARTSFIQGSQLSEWFSRLSSNTVLRVSDEIRKGMFAGETVGDMVRRIRGRAGPGGYYGGVMQTTTREATALVRTAAQTISNNARDRLLAENSQVVKGRGALVTLDLRTSDTCKGRSGNQWTMDGKPMPETNTSESYPGPPPWHFQCRTTIIPILKEWSELSPKVKSTVKDRETTQASMNGQVSAKLDYEGWLRKQPKADQLEALGPTKYSLWKEGKLESFRDLLDQSGRPLTVAELQAKYA